MLASEETFGNVEQLQTLFERGPLNGRSTQENGYACAHVGYVLVLSDGQRRLLGRTATGQA
jgi:hypothetical protein